MEYITLNNGVKMPQVGLGTFLIPKQEIERTIITAYDMGYRMFDTAWRYYNEADIARALKNHGVNREDVFITTKLNVDALYFGGYKGGIKYFTNIPRRSIKSAIEESFKNLQTEYIDLFLIHAPFHPFMKMWKALEGFYKEGRIRAIGVSNFLQPHIEALGDISDVVPAVNQFEISPLNVQEGLVKYCHDNGIAVTAQSTFSHYRSNEPRTEIINNPIIAKIAEAHGKSTVQVVLRWMVQRNIIVIPKTWDESKLLENISIFDFSLTQEEMQRISSLDKGVFLNYNSYPSQIGLPKKYRQWEGFDNPNNYPEWYFNRPKWMRKLLGKKVWTDEPQGGKK